jgi:hypothetical protein
MANSILTIDMITRKALEIFENNLVISRNCNRQYDPSFAIEGAKIGSTLRIRLPDRALVTDGAALQVQDENQQWTTLTVASQKHIGINFTTAELTMQLSDFADIVLKPRISQLASAVDADVAQIAAKGIFNSVGTAGTTPATSLVLLQGQQKLNEGAVPMNPRYATVSPAANAGLVEGMKGLFNPTGTIAAQFKNGMMGTGVLGYDEINMSQSVYTHTTGTTPTAPIVAATMTTQGSTTMGITFTSGSPTFRVGDVFTIANVYAVNPQTRQSTGALQQFVVTADLDISATTSGTLTFLPAIYTATHALATVNAFPQASAALTFFGGSATGYPQNLIYHKDAISLATADLVMPQGVDMASRQVHNGISMRIVRQYDINNDRMPCRVDVLYGASVIRPAAAVRLWG